MNRIKVSIPPEALPIEIDSIQLPKSKYYAKGGIEQMKAKQQGSIEEH